MWRRLLHVVVACFVCCCSTTGVVQLCVRVCVRMVVVVVVGKYLTQSSWVFPLSTGSTWCFCLIYHLSKYLLKPWFCCRVVCCFVALFHLPLLFVHAFFALQAIIYYIFVYNYEWNMHTLCLDGDRIKNCWMVLFCFFFCSTDVVCCTARIVWW